MNVWPVICTASVLAFSACAGQKRPMPDIETKYFAFPELAGEVIKLEVSSGGHLVDHYNWGLERTDTGCSFHMQIQSRHPEAGAHDFEWKNGELSFRDGQNILKFLSEQALNSGYDGSCHVPTTDELFNYRTKLSVRWHTRNNTAFRRFVGYEGYNCEGIMRGLEGVELATTALLETTSSIPFRQHAEPTPPPCPPPLQMTGDFETGFRCINTK